jgi:hypothetical protein
MCGVRIILIIVIRLYCKPPRRIIALIIIDDYVYNSRALVQLAYILIRLDI